MATVKEVQAELVKRGYGPLVTDGIYGPKTKAAIIKFQKDNGIVADGAINPATVAVLNCTPSAPKGRIMKNTEMTAIYGKPGDATKLVVVQVPWLMTLDWPPYQTTRKVVFHKDGAERLDKAFKCIYNHYGEAEIKRLGLNRFGGTFNHRPMRGLEKKYAAAIAAGNFKLAETYLSNHSWATAIDLHPSMNQLRWNHTKAVFAKPEYKAMIQCFYDNGFVGLGPEEDRDWMHFQLGY